MMLRRMWQDTGTHSLETFRSTRAGRRGAAKVLVEFGAPAGTHPLTCQLCATIVFLLKKRILNIVNEMFSLALVLKARERAGCFEDFGP